MNNNKLGIAAISFIAPVIAGVIGSWVTLPNLSPWYEGLMKPSFNPPNWLFGPVWTLLYLLMGIALYLAWTENIKKRTERGWAIRAFFFQLVLNVVWSIVFFGFHNLWLGVIIILGLWGMILLTMKLFWGLSPSATYLLIPYIAWVTFATILNIAIALLN